MSGLTNQPPGLARPALRALVGAGIQNLEQLSQFNEAEIRNLHGIGPNALEKLRLALIVQELSFAVQEDYGKRTSSIGYRR